MTHQNTLAGDKNPTNEKPKQIAPSIQSIQAALKFLRAVLKIVRDRSFYPKNHPQIINGMDKLDVLLAALFEERTERIFVFIDGQVYIDDLLAGEENNLNEIAQLFYNKKLEALSLRKGLSMGELRLLVDHLANPETPSEESSPFQALHIGIGTLQFGENGEKQIIPLFKKFGVNLPRQGEHQGRFTDEIELLREIYSGDEQMKKRLLSHVGNVLHRLETRLFENITSVIPLAHFSSFEEYLYVHAINLCLLTMAQAAALGYSQKIIRTVGMGALLHDIGKTRILTAREQNGQILDLSPVRPLKPLHSDWKLSDAEIEDIKNHPAQGALLLLEFPEIPRIAALIVYEHHLKYDGSGYPKMTQKRTQHIASRLTAISDQFDAMRSRRPEHFPPHEILEAMQSEKGTGLDPCLFEKFGTLIKSRSIP